MLKRIIIISVIYIGAIFVLTLNMEKIGNSSIFLILAISLAFSFLIIREIYKRYIVGFKPKNTELNYSNSNSQTMGTPKKISTRPFLFGLENKLLSDDDFYFDNENFYAVNKEFQKAIFKLRAITEISKTAIEINNRRLWQIKIQPPNEGEVTFKFAHNYTIWNKDFLVFYDKMKSLNPAVIKSKWNFWSM